MLTAALFAGLVAAPPAFAAAASAPTPTPLAPREAVDIELVIATDVSPSIDAEEAHLQREGTIEAFLNPQVVSAIQSGALGKIGVAYIDFSAREFNKVVINWRIIKDKASAAAFADALRKAPPTYGRHTSISSAIELGQLLIETNNLDGTKRVIDISGDGPNNWGTDISVAREAAVKRGIVINGLPIVDDHPGFGNIADLDKYYINCVIGGPAAFIVVAKGFQDFSRAIRNKLVAEISSDTPPAKNPLLIKVAAAAAPLPPMPVRPIPAQPPRTPPSQTSCGNQFGGFGPFNGFDFPPRR